LAPSSTASTRPGAETALRKARTLALVLRRIDLAGFDECGPVSTDRSMQGLDVMKPSDVLRKLIRACVDDECTLRHESNFVDGSAREALARLAHEREQFVEDLERLGQWQPPHDGSWAELSREAGRNIVVTAAGRNNGDAIATCRHSRARTEALYDEALQAPWPDETRRVLEAQRRRLQDALLELSQLQF
jgi:hypothetical protein